MYSFKYDKTFQDNMSERKEAFMRILVAIISGIIIGLWKLVVDILSIFHWFYVLITGKRSKSIAEFCNVWATQNYRVIRYMTFTTNARPFPFSDVGEVLHTVDIKKKK